MSYSVDWTDDALDALAAAWTPAPPARRQAITRAQAIIDRRLAADPVGSSIPLSEGLYAIEVAPLRAQFELSEPDQLVSVVSVGELP